MIQAKFEATCKHCGKPWKVGDQINYSKDPKAVCIDSGCFEKQKGLILKAVQAGAEARAEHRETVNWPTLAGEYTPDQEATLQAEEIYCQMAVEATKKLHPKLDPNSSTFGQIVSAKEGHLIQLAKIKAIRELRSEKNDS